MFWPRYSATRRAASDSQRQATNQSKQARLGDGRSGVVGRLDVRLQLHAVDCEDAVDLWIRLAGKQGAKKWIRSGAGIVKVAESARLAAAELGEANVGPTAMYAKGTVGGSQVEGAGVCIRHDTAVKVDAAGYVEGARALLCKARICGNQRENTQHRNNS